MSGPETVRHRVALALLGGACLLGVVQPAAAQQSDNALFDSGQVVETSGEAVFTHICQGCHMPDGRGAQGAGHYPSLQHDPRLSTAQYPVALLLHGRGAMPYFANMLTDPQIAAVVNYLRSHFGNHYTDTISAAQVKAMRP